MARRVALLDAVAVLAIFLGTRAVQLLIVAWMAGPDPVSVKDRLLKWDGGWFVNVATQGYAHGYTYDPSGQMNGNGLAFFPGYPMLIRGISALGLEARSAALWAAWIAAGAACLLLHRFGIALRDRRLGFVLVTLYCGQPMSVVLGMGYSEGMFTALVVGALLAAYRRHWLIAGVVGLAAALTRPTGLAVAIALAVAAGMAVRERAAARLDACAAAFMALLGVPAYILWVGARVGHLDAWFRIQTAGWGTTTDWGRSTWEFLDTAVKRGDSWVQMSVALILIAAVVSAAFSLRAPARADAPPARGWLRWLRGWTWPPLVVYGVLALGAVLGQAGYYHSKPRLLVPVLLTLIGPGFALARARTGTAVAVLAGYSLFGLWYGAYMITIWPYTI
ncbi:MAG: hypothetical protein J2P15_16805 [Micromonosporaceae bacterium]|nr:hypothetical protein [Micromonosporaceae bacterium]